MKVTLVMCTLLLFAVVVLPMFGSSSAQAMDTNLTKWREHRRQKRFILFENAGICKLVCGITYPVDLSDKKFWRQLVLTMNLQYQFPVPPKPIYWWNLLGNRALADSPSHPQQGSSTDEAQLFLYQFVEALMERRQINGRACLHVAICENAQIHHHAGLFAELLHRLLIPHSGLGEHYLDAYRQGRHGVDCRATYPAAQNCLLDAHLYDTEDHKELSTF